MAGIARSAGEEGYVVTVATHVGELSIFALLDRVDVVFNVVDAIGQRLHAINLGKDPP